MTAHRLTDRSGWFEERLGLRALGEKYGHKAFPVHSSFFLGEMAALSFVILVLTGVYLGLMYTPSNAEVEVASQRVPEAYASVQLIESIPVANLIRNVHHWAAHVMIASILLHAARVFFTGTYRRPREVNWVVGIVLLGLALMGGFVGYGLPWDAFAVTATGIGYALARSIPLVGDFAAGLFFGGAFPTLGSLPRLYTIHVVVVPAGIAAVLAIHLLVVLKQKHSQPGYARTLAEPGKVLGVSMWPHQALMAGQLLLLMLGGLSFLAAFVPVHPLSAYGPPTPETPAVKPDWYLLWIFGLLKMIPAGSSFGVGPVTVGPEFMGGILFPGVAFGVATLVPWLDRSNRGGRRYEYIEPLHQGPARIALGAGALAGIAMLWVAAYYDEIGLSLAEAWVLTLASPTLFGLVLFASIRRAGPASQLRFDPTADGQGPSQPGVDAFAGRQDGHPNERVAGQ